MEDSSFKFAALIFPPSPSRSVLLGETTQLLDEIPSDIPPSNLALLQFISHNTARVVFTKHSVGHTPSLGFCGPELT